MTEVEYDPRVLASAEAYAAARPARREDLPMPAPCRLARCQVVAPPGHAFCSWDHVVAGQTEPLDPPPPASPQPVADPVDAPTPEPETVPDAPPRPELVVDAVPTTKRTRRPFDADAARARAGEGIGY